MAEEISMLDIVMWVFHNLGDTKIKEKDAPNKGAYTMLQTLNGLDDADKWKFYKDVMSKLLPSKQEISSMTRFQDSGRNALELLDRFEAGMRLMREEEKNGRV